MEQGILKFDLEDRLTAERFILAVHSVDLYLAVKDIEEALRTEEKYKDNELAGEMRTMIREKLQEHNLHLEMLS